MGITIKSTIHLNTYASKYGKLSKLLGSQLGAKRLGSSLPPRQLASRPQRLEELRNPTVTDLVQSLSVRSEGTRSPPSCSSASCPSSVLSVKLLRTSRRTSGSKLCCDGSPGG